MELACFARGGQRDPYNGGIAGGLAGGAWTYAIAGGGPRRALIGAVLYGSAGLAGTAAAEYAMSVLRPADGAGVGGLLDELDRSMEKLPHWFPVRKLSEEECASLRVNPCRFGCPVAEMATPPLRRYEKKKKELAEQAELERLDSIERWTKQQLGIEERGEEPMPQPQPPPQSPRDAAAAAAAARSGPPPPSPPPS